MEAVPAPFWFVQFFKVVGFVLHMIPMGIWFAGLPVVIACALWNCERARFFARRISMQLPVMMALGINFAIVPLLFLQTTYYKAFYTATILTAWYWIAVIPIVLVGYYSIYIAAYSHPRGESDECHLDGKCQAGKRNSRMIAFSILASVCLICIAVLNTNGLTLIVSGDQWQAMASMTSHYGAVWGTANNFHDPTLWMRLATMFGLGLITAGVWATLDAHFLMRQGAGAKNVPATYRQWTMTLACMLAFLGVAILTYTEYVVKTDPFAAIKNATSADAIVLPLAVLENPLSAAAHSTLAIAYPYFGWVLLLACVTFVVLLLAKTGSALFVALAAVSHFLTLAAFGIIRQIGQNAGMAKFSGIEVAKLPELVQWDTLIAFLVCFLLGVGIIAWMIVQCVKCSKE